MALGPWWGDWLELWKESKMWLRWLQLSTAVSRERHWPQRWCLQNLRLFWMKLWEQSSLSKVGHCNHTSLPYCARKWGAAIGSFSCILKSGAFTQQGAHSTFQTARRSQDILLGLPVWTVRSILSIYLSKKKKTAAMFHVYSKIEATIRKLELWDRIVGRNNNKSLDNLCDFVTNEKRRILASVACAIREHLKILKMQLQEYFPVLSEQHSWIQNLPPKMRMPSQVSGPGSRTAPWSYLVVLLWNLSWHRSTWHIYGWIHTYLCETGFSALVALKG